MKCFDCNATCAPEAKFCHNCGRNFRKAASAARTSLRASTARYPFKESLAKRSELASRRLTRALTWIGLAVLVAAAGAVVAVMVRVPELFWLIAVAVAVIVASVLYANGFSESEYYQIPHSRDGDGKHRCIFCGNRGIYRKGEYRTDNTHSYCSKCEEHLFSG